MAGEAMTARAIIAALKGRWHGTSGVCRCPAHDDASPSLSLRDGYNGKPVFHCHAGCNPRDVMAALSAMGLWHDERLSPSPSRSVKPEAKQEDRPRHQRALTIWTQTQPIEGTPVVTYLAKRGIDPHRLPSGITGALRWHPSCPWEDEKYGAMIALLTDAVTGEARAIHRTALTPAGNKIGRKMLGPASGCVIRLWPEEEVHEGLVIGEGIETVLAAAISITHKSTLLQPAWACSTAGLLGTFPVLAGIEALTILVDNDESGVGQRAAEECSARWAEAGREVHLLTPRKLGADFNDVAIGRQA